MLVKFRTSTEITQVVVLKTIVLQSVRELFSTLVEITEDQVF